MHKLAKEWDDKYRNIPARNQNNMINGKRDFIPIGRPCDRCGEVAELAFIHTHCQREEQIELLATYNKPKDIAFIEMEEDCPMDDWDLASQPVSISLEPHLIQETKSV